MGPELGILERMIRIRMVEQYVARRYPEQKMRCPTHLCLGQEAVPAVFGELACDHDIFVGTCRSHGYYLAKGGDLAGLFAELLGTQLGCSKGFGGSMHVIDLAKNFWGTSAIVAGGVPIAAGAAFALKYKKKAGVVVAFLGDAAVEEGVVYETVNLSLLHQLPIIFVCENNGLAITTPIELRQCSNSLHDRFATMGLRGARVELNDMARLIEAAMSSYASARAGLGPSFVEYRVSRWCSHVGHDYSGPVDSWWQDPIGSGDRACPICVLRDALAAQHVVDLEMMRRLRRRISQQIETAYRRAQEQPAPAGPNLTRFVYASGLVSRLPAGSCPASDIEFEYSQQSRLVNAF